ncbi:MAG: GspH/FimT family protein [Halieaceae bacterium]
MARDRRRCGFSLIELLLVTALVALLVNTGGGMYSLLERQRSYVTVLELRRMINYARSEAVHRETRVTLCAIASDGRCQRHWSGREIATFVDANRNYQLDPGEAIRQVYWPDERGKLVWRAALRRRYLVFNPGGDTAQNGSFILCQKKRGSPIAQARRGADVVVVVNRGGRNYVAEPGSRSCA